MKKTGHDPIKDVPGFLPMLELFMFFSGASFWKAMQDWSQK